MASQVGVTFDGVEDDAPLTLAKALLAGSLLFLGLCTILTSEGAVLEMEGMPPNRWGWVTATLPLAVLVVVVPWERFPAYVFLVALGAVTTFSFIFGWESGFYESRFGAAVEAATFLILSTIVGLTQRRVVPTAWALFMLVTFLMVYAAVGTVEVLVVGAVLGTPLCVAQGEVVAWSQDEVRASRHREVRRGKDLHRLTTSITRLRQGVPTGEAAATVADLARSLLGAEGAYVVLVDAVGDPQPVGAPPFAFTPRLRGLVARAVSTSTRAQVDAPDGRVLALPLVVEGVATGALLVRREAEGAFDEFTLELGELLAAEAAGVLGQIRTIESLSAETHLDALTGVGNRRHAEHLIGAASAEDALLLFDLDRFKPVNDTYGHAVGDQLLCELTSHLRRSTRSEDAIARFGGDEFVVLVRAEEGDAAQIAERLRGEWELVEPLSTVSIGIAVHDGHRDGKATFDLADQALYRAKERGGNCVEVFTD
jgi:diguanylate cyclase (GGDEF)-like protein